jgi:transposase
MIDDDHSARSIWEMIGRLDLSLYVAKIAAVEGRVGRDHTAPQLLISLWLYAYSQGVSSAREIARRCEYEPPFQWLCGLQPISHRTLSGFRSDNKDALGSVFVQVVGVLSAEGLITMVIGSFFGVGGTASYVPSSNSLYAGATVVVGLGVGGGSGVSASAVTVPAGQNPNSIANGPSYSLTYQPLPFLGSTVVKSPGSGPPVVGPSVGTRIPVSGGVSYNVCVTGCC